ncbi:MAG TPA: DUF3343 domain-containing protein [Deltaproteobacteria bacterium]|jgi:hypothetical protein|nr:DUF3343 domain-containing protein [Deltaproteobacteria bacterium]HOI06909.1 DUF3343 domain-containing protein [Deltaproteobacteria bacterium]
MTAAGHCVLLFHSVSQALLAEKVLKQEGIPHKVIPVPRQISSDCGVCIRFEAASRERITSALTGRVEVREICPL